MKTCTVCGDILAMKKIPKSRQSNPNREEDYEDGGLFCLAHPEHVQAPRLARESITVGNHYRNLKTGNDYVVVGFARDSEADGALRVTYRRGDGSENHTWPWSRPIDLFCEKFEAAS